MFSLPSNDCTFAKIIVMQAIFCLLPAMAMLIFAGSASANAVDPASEPSAPLQTQSQSQSDAPSGDNENKENKTDNNEDSWIFAPGPYTDNKKTGKRVWQYAQEKPAFRESPQSSAAMPRHYSSDPFFAQSVDLFFFDNPDPFYMPPENYSLFSRPFESNSTSYGLTPTNDNSSNSY
jgi:hypothetical protein